MSMRRIDIGPMVPSLPAYNGLIRRRRWGREGYMGPAMTRNG